jgi:hypothetical protein
MIPLYKPVKYAIGGIFAVFTVMCLDERRFGCAGLFAAASLFMFRWAYYHETFVPPPSRKSKIILGGCYAFLSLVFLLNGAVGNSILFASIAAVIFLMRYDI